ncbi:P-loop NTPase fold protein [Mycobacterium sp. AMU20-3851]|uniref:P-loop NTPase fold protein n=1 Tax=Mycobacterium sp. AMU20-3851 TaxID=3122055 RepID=UPI003754859A
MQIFDAAETINERCKTMPGRSQPSTTLKHFLLRHNAGMASKRDGEVPQQVIKLGRTATGAEKGTVSPEKPSQISHLVSSASASTNSSSGGSAALDRRRFDARQTQATAKLSAGDVDEAIELFSANIDAAVASDEWALLIQARRGLGEAYLVTARSEEALHIFLAIAEEAEDETASSGLIDDATVAEAHGDVAGAMVRLDQRTEAIRHLELALDRMQSRFGTETAMSIRMVRRQLALLYLASGAPAAGLETLDTDVAISRQQSDDRQAHQEHIRAQRIHQLVKDLAAARIEREASAITAELIAEMTSWYPEGRWLGGEPVLRALVGASPARLVVARISCEIDSPDTPDRLGVDADARALAALLASRSMTPPLALGVYGSWGSGKTFLMRRIQSWITQFEKRAAREDSAFEHGIAHVRFSAWHYADGNLWASLLSEVFQALNQTPTHPEATLAAAMAKIDGAQQIRAGLQQRVDEARNVVDAAEAAVAEAQSRLQAAISTVAEVKAKDLLAALDNAKHSDVVSAELRDKLDQASTELGIPTAQVGARSLLTTANEVVHLTKRTKVLATTGKHWWSSPLALSVLAFAVIATAGIAIPHIVDAQQWTTPAAAAAAQFAALCTASAAWIGRQSRLVKTLLAPAEAVQREIEARVATVRAEHQAEIAVAQRSEAAAQIELTTLTEQHVAAAAQARAAESEHDHLTGTVLLQRYLAERAGSDDYERHQGLVALAHRDLKNLSDYLTTAHNDTDALPSLRRIVLYVDDRDRCEPEVVADVLAAVHLLLALPLFAVVVGVDPHWLEQSLAKTHRELFGAGAGAVMPADYLEKIFQLTYTLPAMSAASCEQLLTGVSGELLPSASEPTDPRAPTGSYTLESAETPTNRTDSRTAPTAPPLARTTSVSLEDERMGEALSLGQREITDIGLVAALVATTPRRAKRFLSTYLVVRARVYADHRPYTGPSDESSRGLLLLVALMVGTPTTTAALSDPTLASSTDKVRQWINDRLNTPDPVADSTDRQRLADFTTGANPMCDVPMHNVVLWLDVASRYMPLPGRKSAQN